MWWRQQEMDLWKSTRQLGLMSLPSGNGGLWLHLLLTTPRYHLHSKILTVDELLQTRLYQKNYVKHLAGIKRVIVAQSKPLQMLIRPRRWQSTLIILIKVDSGCGWLYLFSTMTAAAWLHQGSNFVIFILFGAQWKSVLLNLHRCGQAERNKQACLHRIEKWFAYLRFCGNYCITTVQPHNMSQFL